MWKKINLVLFSFLIALTFNASGYAEIDDVEMFDEVDVVETEDVVEADDIDAEQYAVEALENYNVAGSLFERITNLEQEKVVMQLEKERAQLDLELERLNAEKIKLQMELDTLSGRSQQQQYELEAAKQQLEIQTEQLKRQRDAINAADNNDSYYAEEVVAVQKPQPKKPADPVTKRYKLINVVGVDNQLQATIQEVDTGQNRRIAVGKDLDGYTVKSISLSEGIVLEKDGEEESFNIGK